MFELIRHRFDSVADVREPLLRRVANEDGEPFRDYIRSALAAGSFRLLDETVRFSVVELLSPPVAGTEDEVLAVLSLDGEALALLSPHVETFRLAVDLGAFLVPNDCPACDGSGVASGVDLRHEDLRFCPTCDGDGRKARGLPPVRPLDEVEEVEERIATRLVEASSVLARAVAVFGNEAQSRMVFEECGELVAELARWQRGRSSADDVAGEVADVLLVALQLARILGGRLVEGEVVRKLDRLRERVQAREKRSPAPLPCVRIYVPPADDEVPPPTDADAPPVLDDETDAWEAVAELRAFNDAVEARGEELRREEEVRETVEALRRIEELSAGREIGRELGSALREVVEVVAGVAETFAPERPATPLPEVDPVVRHLQSQVESLRTRLAKLEGRMTEAEWIESLPRVDAVAILERFAKDGSAEDRLRSIEERLTERVAKLEAIAAAIPSDSETAGAGWHIRNLWGEDANRKLEHSELERRIEKLEGRVEEIERVPAVAEALP